MRRHRFIADVVLEEGELGLVDRALAHQLKTVLRVRPGDTVLLGDGRGLESEALVRGYQDDVVSVTLGTPYPLATEPRRRIEIYAAVSKRDTFEWAAQKATECGASRIVPVISERTIKQGLNLARLRSIVKEAAEQSGRGVVPDIGEVTTFADMAGFVGGARLIAALGDDATPIRDVQAPELVSIAIGPEGGFSEKEVAEAVAAGWQKVSLGPRVLRAETAVAIASYVLGQE